MVNSIERRRFGHLPDGDDVDAVVLRNANGLRAKILTYGATLAVLEVPDRDGRSRNVVLGFATLDDYRQARGHLGGVIGRYANRLCNGRFTLDGRDVRVSVNEPPNTLHGGAQGFDRAVWRVEALQSDPAPAVTLAHVSPDGDQGFPGRVDVRVRYTLVTNALRLDYTATTDRTTVINLTNHSYFNLRGAGSGDVLDHELLIDADAFTPIDQYFIPTGERRPVTGTPFDFRTPTPIGSRIGLADEQLVRARGYDHNYVLQSGSGGDPVLAARVREPLSGLTMEVLTTEPGVQFYSGNFLNGRPYRARDGFCLETQHFPDSPNHPDFPSTVLRPGEVFQSATIFRFPFSPLSRGEES
ncbi:aldose epimerase family protein [Reyranella sp. CPCC 100927]|uniref:aldose epimerase family protein n=1 Tax=Reyranella sp. CPCC 100927 TaxID=2599616 RepID=UPI0011B5237A|nr:aldose epimerase family protein [Reyranella sp. CPCC 100927]TWS97605.1 galactose mutarotase [Reyranella sp. CPCC 100927]